MLTPEMIKALPTYGYTRADYDALTDCLNQTLAKEVLISPGHYLSALQNPQKETAALRIGKLTHSFCLEPETFKSTVVCLPDDAPKKPTEKQLTAKKPKLEHLEAQSWWQSFEARSQGMTVADPEEYAEAVACGTALKAELEAHGITPLATELSLTCPYGDIKLKSQIDLITADGWIVDLKTFGDYLTPNNVLNTVYKRGYHLQGAFYSLIFRQVFGMRPKGFKLVCVEKFKPYATATYELSPELLAEGGLLLTKAIENYSAAKSFNSYPLYPKQVQLLKPRKAGADSSPISFA